MQCAFKYDLCALVIAAGEEGKPRALSMFLFCTIEANRAMRSDDREQDKVSELKAEVQFSDNDDGTSWYAGF